jgi:hypothetical protein
MDIGGIVGEVHNLRYFRLVDRRIFPEVSSGIELVPTETSGWNIWSECHVNECVVIVRKCPAGCSIIMRLVIFRDNFHRCLSEVNNKTTCMND